MKSSMLLAASGAVLAMATPRGLDKRAYETEVVTEWTTVYVTEGASATMYGPGAHQIPTTSTSTTPTPEPSPPAPTSIPAPEPVVAHESQPPPPPVVYVTPTTSKKAAAATTKVAQHAAAPSDYASTALYHHNIHRANHSAPAMSWSDAHASYAAQTAAKCVFKHDLGPGGGGYGQNLAMWGSSANAQALGGSKALAQGITNMWYNGELKKFPASSYGKSSPDMSNFEGWGHFSQLVWSGSKEVGCHSQYCAPGTMYATMGAWFTVCNYHPAGNVGGGYGKNVLPPLGQAGLSA